MRAIVKEDIIHLKAVIDSTALFPADMLDDMTADFFQKDDHNEIWLTMEANDIPIAITFCAPEKMTMGTYNLYLIAVHKDFQGKGLGSIIMTYVENQLQKLGARILLVETSSLPEYELTRKFYDKLGYTREAVIREFYQKGEDKIVFWKNLRQ